MANFELLTGNWLDQELGTADSTVLFTSTRRAQAVNDGYAEFCEQTECLIEVSTVACSCNTVTYNLLSSAILEGSTNFIRLAPRGVEYHWTDSGGNLTQLAGDDFPRRDIEVMNREDPGWRQSTAKGIPTGYYIDDADGKILLGLDIPPDIGSSETGKLIVPFITRPTPMTSTSDIPFTVGSSNVRVDLYPFHKALTHYAAAMLEKLRQDTDASDRQMALFTSYLQRYRQAFKNKGENFVRLARNYLKEASRSRRTGSGVNGAWDPRRDFD